MKILTQKNGVALIAVLTVLLILTILLPAMFSMSSNATKNAMEGNDKKKASYLARTMIEMSVAAFQDQYDLSEEKFTGDIARDNEISKAQTILEKFYNIHKKMEVSDLYMYRRVDVPYPKKPVRGDYGNQQEFDQAMEAFEEQMEVYYGNSANNVLGGVVYSINLPTGITSEDQLTTDTSTVYTVAVSNGSETQSVQCNYVGKSECTITYNDETTYYEIDKDGNTTVIDVDKYTGGQQAIEQKISAGVDVSAETQYMKIQNKNVIFESKAVVNGKGGNRRCIIVLPTKPSEESWITVANLDVGCNQIFPDTSLATGRMNINYEAGLFIDGKALKQPLYYFSCVGNMIISDEGLTITRPNANGVVETIPYTEYLREKNASYRHQDMSFGLHPETGTREPDNDPNFNCLRTYNMRSWAEDAQLDNFVAYTATNAIQVDLPVNLVMNPCRGDRIGDGLDRNASLYKVLIFQAPNIVFNSGVASFLSLNEEDNAHRMTSIMLAAPANTPYSYSNGTRKKVVKAGKVYFAKDAYIWLVPYGETGSSYKTQTVYYKDKDIILYKIANAGDIYYFNAEVETSVNGKKENAGFSLTGYFMDVIYRDQGDQLTKNKWWQIWSNAKLRIFNNMLDYFGDETYVKDDLKYVGNVKDGTGDKLPVVDDFYVIWDS